MAADNDKKTLDYGAFLVDLETKRAALEQAIASVRAVMSSGALSVSVGDSMPPMASSVSVGLYSGDVPVGAFLGKSIPEAARLCLQIVKKKLTSREIADALKKGGIESTAQNFPALVHSIVLRASRTNGSPIVKLDRSHWGLAEWYPASMRTTAIPEKRSYKRRRGRPKKAESKAEPKEKKLGSGAVSRITQVLRSKPGVDFSAEDIAAPANVALPVVRLMLGRLVASKQAEKTVAGKYRATTVN